MVQRDQIWAGVNGDGVTGKRIGDAVRCQADTAHVGVADGHLGCRIRSGFERSYQELPAYPASPITVRNVSTAPSAPTCRPVGRPA